MKKHKLDKKLIVNDSYSDHYFTVREEEFNKRSGVVK